MVDGRYTYFMVLINQHTHTTEWGKHLLEDHPISQLLIGMILQVGRGRVGRFWNLREHETQKKMGKRTSNPLDNHHPFSISWSDSFAEWRLFLRQIRGPMHMNWQSAKSHTSTPFVMSTTHAEKKT